MAIEAPSATRNPTSKGLKCGKRLPTAPDMTMFEGLRKGIRFKSREKIKTPKYSRPRSSPEQTSHISELSVI